MALPVIDVTPGQRGLTILPVGSILTMTFPLLRVDFAPEASVTEHPIELGAEVSDHVQQRSDRFTAEVYVTDSPAGSAPTQPRVQVALAFLKNAIGKLLTVVLDGEGTFSSYVLEGYSHAKTTVEGRSIVLRFKQIRIASALSVTIPPGVPAPVAAAGAPTEEGLGVQATTAGTPVSALKDIKEASSSLSPVAFIRGLVGW
jgi:hypothetical protein